VRNVGKKFACKDIGMQCGFEAHAADENALLQQIAQHAKSAHNMSNIDQATMAKIRAAIKEE
jgi:predicted small metal-binding protein